MHQPSRGPRWLLLALLAAAAAALPAACGSPLARDDAARPAAQVAGSGDAQGDPLSPDSPINAADPSETPAPTATPRPTTDPSLPPTPSPTPWPTLATIPPSVFDERLSEPSPDGAWRVRAIQHGEQRSAPAPWDPSQERYWGYHSQHLVSADGTITHTVYADWIPDGLGAPRPDEGVAQAAIVGWAKDGTLEIKELGSGWGRPTPGAPTRRIDARTGEPRK